MNSKIIFAFSAVIFTIAFRVAYQWNDPVHGSSGRRIARHAELIHQALETSIEQQDSAGSDLVELISRKVGEYGFHASHQEVLKKALEAREASVFTRRVIDELKTKVISTAKGKDMKGFLTDPTGQQSTSVLINDSTAYQLEKVLDAYVEKLRTLTYDSLEFERIAKSGADLLGSESRAWGSRIDFPHFTFDGMTASLALALLTQIESEVVKYEFVAVNYFRQLIGSRCRWEVVTPFVIPNSCEILDSQDYHADVFLVRTSYRYTPEISVNGERIAVDSETKKAEVKFKATAKPYEFDPKTGIATKTYRVAVRIPYLDGDTTLTKEVTYYVMRE